MKLTSTLFLRKVMMATAIFTLTLCLNAQDYDFEQTEEGMVVMEAENYTELVIPPGSETTWEDTVTTPAGFSGETAMIAGPSDASAYPSASDALDGAAFMKYAINFTQTDSQYVWARANRTGGGDDSYHVGLNGTITEFGEFIMFEGAIGENPDVDDAEEWVWINQSNVTGGPASVFIAAPGVNDFEVYIRETDFKIDKILLTTSHPANFQPNPDTDYEETLPSTTSINSIQNSDLSLRSYPSPFTDETTISYNLRKPGHVSIKVYSIAGNEIATVYEGYRSAGQSEATWSPKNALQEGIYFIQIKTDRGTQSIKTIKLN